tara:strand:+ start:1808 stop:2134 length:327 start_codon:yes stop_codon:yes gene_type:complete
MRVPFYQDISDYFVVRTKTITRIAIADIMADEMLLKWYKKILDNQSNLQSFKGFGYFESEHTHGYLMASWKFNKMALEVIKFQLELRNITSRNNRELSLLEKLSNNFQ